MRTIFVVLFALIINSNSMFSVEFGNRETRGKLENKQIDEASGLAASRINSGILYTHNDSQADAIVYAINDRGESVAKIELEDIENRDWEDISVGPGPEKGVQYIYVADIGDNDSEHKYKYIYRFKEPKINDSGEEIKIKIDKNDIDRIKYKYPDGKRDAESMTVDPLTADIIVVSKREENVRVYVAYFPQDTDDDITLDHIATLPFGDQGFDGSGVTAADISPDGLEILIKDYTYMYYYNREENEDLFEFFTQDPKKVKYTPEPQGESVAWAADGNGYFTLSEVRLSIWPSLYYYQKINNSVDESKKKVQKVIDTGEFLKFENIQNEFHTLHIYNLMGSPVFKLNLNGLPNYIFNKRNLSSSVYFYHLLGNNSSRTGKFIVY